MHRTAAWRLGSWIVVAALVGAGGARGAVGGSCAVLAAIDAATLRVACATGERTVALRGVQAPRPGPPGSGGEAYGTEARFWVETWLAGRPILLDGDRVLVDGAEVRPELLRRGLVYCAGGDVAFAVACHAIEAEARRGGRGTWSWAAWQSHQHRGGEAVALGGQEERSPGAPETLGSIAARLARKSWEERKAEFEAALAIAAATHVEGPAALPPPLPVVSGSPPRAPGVSQRQLPSGAPPKRSAPPERGGGGQGTGGRGSRSRP